MRTRSIPALAQSGHTIWQSTYKFTRNDDEVIERFLTATEEAGGDIEPYRDMAIMREVQFVARWCDRAFPKIKLGHRFAASLMATKASTDLIGDVVLPWDTFLVELPNGMLSASDAQLTHMGVMRRSFPDGDVLDVHLYSESDQVISVLSSPIDDLLTVPSVADFDSPESMGSLEKKLIELCVRLLIGICLTLSDPTRLVFRGDGKSGKNKRKHDQPTCRTYELLPPAEIQITDCREAIRDYVAGVTKSGPTVQTLVRGHWKAQAYGPGGTLRKIIQIQAYWRGPEDAPIAWRERVLSTVSA